MKKRIIAVTCIAALCSAPVLAILGVGDIVYDPTNFEEAVKQLLQMEQQYVQLSGYSPSDLRLDWREFFRTELMSPRPDVFGGRGIDDPHIHPQSFPIAALSAPGNDVVIFTF